MARAGSRAIPYLPPADKMWLHRPLRVVTHRGQILKSQIGRLPASWVSVSTPALRVRRTTNGDADVGVQIARGLASRNFLPKRCLREQNFRGAPRRIPALGSDFGEYTLPTHGRYRLRWAEAYPTHPPTIEPILPHRAKYPNPVVELEL